VNLHRRSASGINPAAEDTTAGEHNGMGSFGVNHGHFQVAIKWCGFDVQPIHATRFSIRAVPALIRIKCPHSWRRIIFQTYSKQARLKVIALNGRNSPRHHLLRDYVAFVCIGNAEHQFRQFLGERNYIDPIDESPITETYAVCTAGSSLSRSST
jgi:hypothetical protein